MKKTTRFFGYLLSGSLIVGSAACGNSKPLLTRASAADPGDCSTGGTLIQTGEDKNGNGILEDTEVSQTTPVCNGTVTTGATGSNGKAPIIQSSAVPPGDPACPSGGSKLEIGYDDGTGGGTAGDGILQAGEITSSKVVCSFGQTPTLGSLIPPEGAAGTAVLHANGGDGSSGGSGGTIVMDFDNGSLGGHVKAFKTGAADSGFTMPAIPFTPGDNPVLIDADTTLNVYNNENDAITSGDPVFLLDQNSHFLETNIDDVAVPATSLDIVAGVTFTVPYYLGSDSANLTVAGDVRNAGTIRIGRKADAKSAAAQVGFSASNYFGKPGSVWNGAGDDIVGGTGGNGPNVVYFVIDHALINEGTINAGGGAGNVAGTAPSVMFIFGDDYTVNTGTISTHGGNAAVGLGTASATMIVGPYFYNNSASKAFYNSGIIDNSGGDGVTGAATAGTILIGFTGAIAMKESGSILNKGGNCLPAAVNCTGGDGGVIEQLAYGTPVFSSATIDNSGGNGKGTGAGGSGTVMILIAGSGTGANHQTDRPTGSMHFSGNILANGGNGGAASNGGQAGVIILQIGVGTAALGQELVFFGYSEIATNGGTATVGNGGQGGTIIMQNSTSYPTTDGDVAAPGGAVVNYVDLISKGGNGGTAGSGGPGGGINLSTQTDYYFGVDFERVINHGHLLVQGGDATRIGGAGGSAGNISLTGIAGIDNQGMLSALGGNATQTGSSCGNGGNISLTSDYGSIANGAVVEANGGSDTMTGSTGGPGGNISMNGVGITSTAMLAAKGGAGGATTTGNGGTGGTIELVSTPPGAAASATYDVSGGAGISNNGTKGSAFADGVDVTP
jgi:hypothetical protein